MHFALPLWRRVLHNLMLGSHIMHAKAQRASDTGAVQGILRVLSAALQDNAAAQSCVCMLNKEEKCMPVAHWTPWTELETFERVLNRVFDLPLPRLFGNDHHEPWQPRTDMYETDAAYVVEVDLPGMTIGDISVQLEETTVIISGQRQSTPPGGVHNNARVERPSGTFQRAFTLPAAVKRDEVQATYANGVLTVTVPKADAARPRQITVQAA